MAKVFVLNRGPHDFSSASKLGELVYLSEGTVDKFSTSLIYRTFERHLLKSSPDDFVIASSLSSMLAVFIGMFASLHHRINLLIYDVKTKTYETRSLSFDRLVEKYQLEGEKDVKTT